MNIEIKIKEDGSVSTDTVNNLMNELFKLRAFATLSINLEIKDMFYYDKPPLGTIDDLMDDYDDLEESDDRTKELVNAYSTDIKGAIKHNK